MALLAMLSALLFELWKHAVFSQASVRESNGLTILFFTVSVFLMSAFPLRWRGSIAGQDEYEEVASRRPVPPASPLQNASDSPSEGSAEEITDLQRSELELRRLNRALSTLSRCNEALTRASDEQQLLNQICEIVVQVGGYALAWVGYAEERKTVRPMAQSGLDKGYVEQAQITWDETERGRGPIGTAIRTGRICVLRHALMDPQFAPWREEALRHGFASLISLPLRHEEHSIGALSIYSAEADAFDGREVELLKELADELAYGIRMLRHEAEHRRAEDEVRRSEAKLRALVEQSPLGIFQTHLEENRFLEVNPALVKMLGYDSAEEVLAQTLTTDIYLTPEERNKTWEQLRRSGYNDVRVQCKRKDGTPVTFHLTGRVIEDIQSGSRIYEGFVEDVTKRVQTRRALRESEERFRQVVEGAPLGIFIQTDGFFRYLNPAAMALFGARRADQIVGQPFLDRIHPDFRPVVIERARLVSQEGRRVPFLEERMLRLDGTEVDAEVTAIPFRFEGRHGALVFVHDITERKQEERKSRALEQQLQQSQKMEAVGRLAGGVAHDFNNLLMVIRSYTEILEENLSFPSALRKWTLEITKATQRAASLTGQLLAFSRKQMITPVVLNVNAVIEDTAKMLVRLIGEDIDFVVQPDESLWPIEADADQIFQILMNLCVNARDAMPRGGTLTISTGNVAVGEGDDPACLQPGEYVKLSVRDTGVGIDRGVIEKIFEPFFSTKEAGKGTGLGLAMVYGIVEQSHGSLSVESEPGQGTCFHICFPKAKGVAIPKLPGRSEVPVGGEETVLVAEDEGKLREAICGYLSSLGYKVLEASTGQQALSMANAHKGRIDILLTDLVMPQMGGKELSQIVEALRPELKTIYMSGYTGDETLRHGLQEMSATFLQKPFRLSTLASALRTTLEARL